MPHEKTQVHWQKPSLLDEGRAPFFFTRLPEDSLVNGPRNDLIQTLVAKAKNKLNGYPNNSRDNKWVGWGCVVGENNGIWPRGQKQRRPQRNPRWYAAGRRTERLTRHPGHSWQHLIDSIGFYRIRFRGAHRQISSWLSAKFKVVSWIIAIVFLVMFMVRWLRYR